jgi:glycosyltransferase involved in cell wall biosynthesis
VVVVYRGGAGPRFIARHPRAVPFILRKADLLVVPSGFLAAAFEPYGLEPRVIPNVIDVSEFRHRERAHFGPKLIWVRHLRPGYNPWMAIEVLNRVREHHPEATLVMVGGGAMLNELRIRIQREGITGVTLTGEVPQTELRRRLDEADIFLNTTTVDNQPRSVMEAIASGLPVVSTNVGGIPYLLKNEDTALLVQSHDAAGMSAAIERLVRDPGLGHALVSRGRQLILQHTWEAVVPRWARALTLPD